MPAAVTIATPSPFAAAGDAASSRPAPARDAKATAPAAAKGLGVAIVTAAGIYQLTIWKERCLRRCRSPVRPLVYYASFRGRGRDVRVGLRHGAACVGCCWGLMIVLVAAGVMNVAVMAALAVVIFTEKVWRYGRPFGQVVGLALVAAGVLAIWFPWLLPGLHVSAMPVM
jgi:predicted metal-binding membrane protein